MIDTINSILLEQRPTNGNRGADERWPDANSLARYRAVYQEIFLSTTAADS